MVLLSVPTSVGAVTLGQKQIEIIDRFREISVAPRCLRIFMPA
jgi:hypothetical protein